MKKAFTKFFIALLSMLMLVTTSTVNISAAQSLKVNAVSKLDIPNQSTESYFDNIESIGRFSCLIMPNNV